MTDHLFRKLAEGRLDPDECDVLLNYIVDSAAGLVVLASYYRISPHG